jgi:hypothetical protein
MVYLSAFCDQCQLNVFNVENLTSYQVRDLVMKPEGRTCMRFFKRFDGTLLTRDCPRGLAMLGYLWNRDKKALGASYGPLLGGLVLFLVVSFSVITMFGDNIRRLYGMSAGGMHFDPAYVPKEKQPYANAPADPRAAVLARFNASPPCPTSRAPVR